MASGSATAHPLSMLDPLSVCMIVKNEELDLPACLESVRDLAGEIVVVDIGSTDATPRLAAAFGANVISFDFRTVDFAAARDCAIAHAQDRWILMLDADETLNPAGREMLKQLVIANESANENADENSGYFLERHNQGADPKNAFTDYVVRLFPNRLNHRYRGRVHETIDGSILSAGGRLQQTRIRIDHKFSSDPQVRRRKNLRYIEILKEEIAADPGDTSRLDFLAAEYHQLEMFEDATAVAEHIALLRPLDPPVHLFVDVYHLLYKPDLLRARADFIQALKLRPGYAEAESFLRFIEEHEVKSRQRE